MVLLSGTEPVIIGLISITGSLFLSLLVIIILLMVLALVFRIPLEFTAIFILPMLLTFMAYDSHIISILGVLLIYVGVLFGKHFFISK